MCKMEISNISGFAEEKSKIQFSGFWDWLVTCNNIFPLWQAQPSFVYVQALIIVGNLITLFHALKNGGQFIQLWIGILLHGFVIEIVSYNLSDIDNFWHAQSPIIFLGRRLPLYILLIYVVFVYLAAIAVDRLKLPKWSEPLATGLVVVLIDYPYDIIGVRLMHWTWHDTDPNIADRHYYVPWNSFYFHASFTASFTFWFHFSRFIVFGKTKKWEFTGSYIKEFGCTVVAALFGMPGGVLLFVPLYHPLHDVFKIHSEVTTFLLFSIYLSIICLSFPKTINKSYTNNYNIMCNYLLLFYILLYYVFFIVLVIFIDPSSEVSIGWHEPIGPCHEKSSMLTALGQTLNKRKYLCLTDNDESYFGWSCLPNKSPPKNGAAWYTICGTPFNNRMEYIIILTISAIFGCSFFFKMLYQNDTINTEFKYNDNFLIQRKRKIKLN